MRFFVVISILCLLYACTKDRVDSLDKKNNHSNTNTDTGQVKNGILFINELLSKGAGSDPDWFEIYNPNSFAVTIDSGELFATDDFGNLSKNTLPAFTFPPKSYTQILCGGQAGAIVNGVMYVSFNFSSSGEEVALCTKDSAGQFIFIDSVRFGPIPEGESYGRVPDGSSNWQIISSPTPGATNQ
ncbi:MAG: hypothetical protein NZM35_01260 [Chitinophagales bacterium]|nr:hypothetical protein [Chitinophagales bacterium]MDW8418065.1 hypothetical protein [Chitinophagales bacterium]